MLRQFLPIQTTIYHTDTKLEGFGFADIAAPSKILPGQIHDEKQSAHEEHLLLAALALVHNNKLLRCGEINTPLRLQELYALLDYMIEISPNETSPTRFKKRFSILQIALPDKELESIRLLHYLLSRHPFENENTTLAHLTLPLDNFFFTRTNKAPTVNPSASTNKLSRLQNIEGWLCYGHWINESFTTFLHSLALTDTAKFSLEASLTDFAHEMSSALLISGNHELADLTRSLGTQEFAKWVSESPITYERMIQEQNQQLELRVELGTYLKTLEEILVVINEKINVLKPLQPELLTIQAIAQLFKELLHTQTNLSGSPQGSIGQQLMLTTLLNSLLDAATIMTCNKSLDSINICFAISLAILQLTQSETLSDVVKMIVDWDTAVLTINLWISEQGQEAFVEWLRNPQNDNELYQPARLITKLRLHVFKNLQTFSPSLLPIEENIVPENIRELIVSPEYLNFLPNHFVEYNDKTGQPITMKPEALKYVIIDI